MSALSSDRPAFSVTGWTKLSGTLSGWSAWPLRLIVGYGFIVHGWAKLSRGPESFAAFLHAVNVPLPLFFAWATTATELIGGLCVLCGAFVAAASLPLSVVLLTALFTVHLPYGFFSVKLAGISPDGVKFGPVGYEHILLYLAGLISLAISGAGPLSLDSWRTRRAGRDSQEDSDVGAKDNLTKTPRDDITD
ncbi:DoxX family protein [Bradyrhizobium sp. WYCCWR 13022]|uniref:DoxX family protein n=1 Tax=unclassified Bradyrhizobium TaxID=2631580 RepID=UPI00263B4B80|nr:DoxX family protein [Bradyrhizobium sp. WYCCWR 13022]MDN4983425.1 DoxX family protein [Bradyrhizobium sp. WYCCWR 13022]